MAREIASTRVLLRALILIEHEANWCKWRNALDVEGHAVDPTSKEAIKWDVMGALDRACFELELRRPSLVEARDRIQAVCGDIPAEFNDNNDHETMLDVIRAAAET